jgi:hypothetical protein
VPSNRYGPKCSSPGPWLGSAGVPRRGGDSRQAHGRFYLSSNQVRPPVSAVQTPVRAAAEVRVCTIRGVERRTTSDSATYSHEVAKRHNRPQQGVRVYFGELQRLRNHVAVHRKLVAFTSQSVANTSQIAHLRRNCDAIATEICRGGSTSGCSRPALHRKTSHG